MAHELNHLQNTHWDTCSHIQTHTPDCHVFFYVGATAGDSPKKDALGIWEETAQWIMVLAIIKIK